MSVQSGVIAYCGGEPEEGGVPIGVFASEEAARQHPEVAELLASDDDEGVTFSTVALYV